MCQNTTMRVIGAWIKRYCVLCSKTYNTLHSCYNFLAGSRQAARVARICEMSLSSTGIYSSGCMCFFSSGEARHIEILTFQLNFTFKLKVNKIPKTTGILTKVFCISGPHLEILA